VGGAVSDYIVTDITTASAAVSLQVDNISVIMAL
jgi:hypothetical protein